jgi:hypothetical protein
LPNYHLPPAYAPWIGFAALQAFVLVAAHNLPSQITVMTGQASPYAYLNLPTRYDPRGKPIDHLD